jgi:type III restriction enzyme
MAFRELEYQLKALAALDAWLGPLSEEKAKADQVAALIDANPDLGLSLPDFPAKAWAKLSGDIALPDAARRPYSPRMSGDGNSVPNATLKVPTGGGKTFLACAALSRIFGRYKERNTGFVLWIVPNEAIYAQTLRALRDREHAYRQTLDRASAYRTIVLEKTDTLRKADIDANLCVMVLMLQSSNRENKDSLRLFRDRGDVHGFMPPDGEQALHKALKERIPNLDIYDLADGPGWPMVKASMGNAMRIIRPVVVMDEGQRAVSDLAYATLYGFNPSFVLELTATPLDVPARAATANRAAKPGRLANILSEITGRELEREGMIKMPMNVSPLAGDDWRQTIGRAWEKLQELERNARAHEGNGGRYIRPILLIQVERTGQEQRDSGHIHADDARDWLKAVAGLDDAEIAYKTAERNDLDKSENKDLLARSCRVRAIITKAALAEGWDCPFAYVLCALATNNNESALTQLVGRVLRQPYAEKTPSASLNECYVFAHRAETQATIDAIKRGLEGDGLGDLARDVVLAVATETREAMRRRIKRRLDFSSAVISLPQVLAIDEGCDPRPLDAETDLFPHIDWGAFDAAAFADGLREDARSEDHQMVRLRAGDRGVMTESAIALAAEAPFDTAYAVRSIGDLVPNAFVAWGIVDAVLSRLRERRWTDETVGKLSGFILKELQTALAAEREKQAATLFKVGLEAGRISFKLHGDNRDWTAPFEIETTLPDLSPVLTAATGGPLERSLFLPVYAAEFNDEERRFALYLDGDSVVRWWHRNGVGRGNYTLRGWRKGNVYPDFLFSALQDHARQRIVALETKGEQLSGNVDTAYKGALLEMLTGAFQLGRSEGLGLEGEGPSFAAAVVLFGETTAKLPALIRGELSATA